MDNGFVVPLMSPLDRAVHDPAIRAAAFERTKARELKKLVEGWARQAGSGSGSGHAAAPPPTWSTVASTTARDPFTTKAAKRAADVAAAHLSRPPTRC